MKYKFAFLPPVLYSFNARHTWLKYATSGLAGHMFWSWQSPLHCGRPDNQLASSLTVTVFSYPLSPLVYVVFTWLLDTL